MTSPEKFNPSYHICRCCKLNLHHYQFPFKRGSKTVRVFGKCISCVDQCAGKRTCQLGK